jgi:peptidoglycan/LPS O-acetylase OafA/YrhL
MKSGVQTDSAEIPGALPKMPQLDALRAFAVLGVMYQHFAHGQRWLGYVPSARLGVQLFFVLSGFLITGILLIARNRVICGESRLFELRQFYTRRFLRIFPLYYAVVLAGAFLGVPGFRQPLLWHLTYSTNIANAITGQWFGASAHFWTLSVEEQFYLVWPWLILLSPQRWLVPAVLGVAIVGPFFRCVFAIFDWSHMAVYTLTPSSLDAFGLGGLLAIARERQQARGSNDMRRRLTRTGLLMGTPAVALTFSPLAWPGHYFWLFTIGANLASALLFTWLIDRAADGFTGVIGRLLTWRPLLYTGKISYGLYLFHFIVVFVILHRIMDSSLVRPMKPIILRNAVAIFALAALTFIAASASWFFYERPLLRLKRFFPYTRRIDRAGKPFSLIGEAEI